MVKEKKKKKKVKERVRTVRRSLSLAWTLKRKFQIYDRITTVLNLQ